MDLNLFKDMGDEMNKFSIKEFIQEIKERLEMMENKLVVDRFEGDFVICEDLKNKKTYNIEKNKLPENIKEGMVVKYDKGKFVRDLQEEKEISNRIKNKMDNLWEE